MSGRMADVRASPKAPRSQRPLGELSYASWHAPRTVALMCWGCPRVFGLRWRSCRRDLTVEGQPYNGRTSEREAEHDAAQRERPRQRDDGIGLDPLPEIRR